MSTLCDIRKTGMDYILFMEALLYTTPGLEPGYLPEKDALHMLSGVSSLRFHSPQFILIGSPLFLIQYFQ